MRGLEMNRPCCEPCAVRNELSFGLGPVLDLADTRHKGLGFDLIGSVARGEACHPVDLELCGKTCLDLAVGLQHTDCVNRAGQLTEGSANPNDFGLLAVPVRGAQNLRKIGLQRAVPPDISACRRDPVTKRYFVSALALFTSPSGLDGCRVTRRYACPSQ